MLSKNLKETDGGIMFKPVSQKVLQIWDFLGLKLGLFYLRRF